MREQSRYIGRFEPIPKDVITGVYVNSRLADNTYDLRRKKPIDVEELIDQASFFAFGAHAYGDTPTGNKRLQGPEMHRGFIIRFGEFRDPNGIIHGQVGAKGSGLSARGVAYFSPPKEVFSPIESNDPQGFFGVRHARQDTRITDVLSDYGARTSRGLAVINLDPERLYEWSLRVNPKNPRYKVRKMLDIVKRNGDEPCIMIRLLGAEREDESTKIIHPPVSSVINRPEAPFQPMPILLRAMGLVKEEMRQRGGADKFQEAYGIPDIVMRKIYEAFLDPREWKLDLGLTYLQLHFFNWNRGVGEVVRNKEFAGNLTFNLHKGNYDILGSWVDFENSLPESGQIMNSIREPIEAKEDTEDKSGKEMNEVIYGARESGRAHALRVAALRSA